MKTFSKLALTALTLTMLTTAAHAAPVKVAVLSGSVGQDTSSQVAAQLNDNTYFNFNANVISGASVTSSAALSGYDVVVLGGSGYSTSEYNGATLASVRSFMQAGGGVVTAGWYRFATISNSGQAAIDANVVTPIGTNGTYNYIYSDTLHITNGTHAITTGVSDISVSGCCIELATSLDAGATTLGTSAGNIGLAYQDLVGRSVYIGLLYFANAGYQNGGLRFGAADRLLEQSVEWASGAGSSDVPEPGILALLGLGLAGLAWSRRRSA